MRKTITITRKGQTTLPAEVRRKLGVARTGGVLLISFDEAHGQVTLRKPVTIAELSERATRRIQPGTPPLTNVDEYYQTHREVRN